MFKKTVDLCLSLDNVSFSGPRDARTFLHC